MTQMNAVSADAIRGILRQTLSLGDRAGNLADDSKLLGALPELDSMAVVSVLTALEQHFGIAFEDDEIDASAFSTLGALRALVASKIGA